jgi:hypothetical protein
MSITSKTKNYIYIYIELYLFINHRYNKIMSVINFDEGSIEENKTNK